MCVLSIKVPIRKKVCSSYMSCVPSKLCDVSFQNGKHTPYSNGKCPECFIKQLTKWKRDITFIYIKIEIYGFHHHHHHHVAPSVRLTLTISRNPSLTSVAPGWASGLHLVSCTELLYLVSSGSSCLCSSMWRGPQEYITYEFVLTSPAVSRMSVSSSLDGFRDGR